MGFDDFCLLAAFEEIELDGRPGDLKSRRSGPLTIPLVVSEPPVTPTNEEKPYAINESDDLPWPFSPTGILTYVE